jgi:DNA-binding IscR family transcriptional regulator
VLRFIEGAQAAKGRGRRKPDSPFSDLWQQVDRAVSDVVDHTTFADLVRGWQERQHQFVHTWEI